VTLPRGHPVLDTCGRAIILILTRACSAEICRPPRLARDTATEAIRIEPDRPEAYTVRASIALNTSWDLGLSAADFGRPIRLDPHDFLTRHWAAWWYLAADRMADARETLDTAVRLDPFSPVGLTARTTFAYLDGDYEAAAADSRLALTLDPDFFRAHLRLGLIDLLSGDVDRGLARIGVARQLVPGLFAREPRLAPLRRFPQFLALHTLREAPPAAPPAVLPVSGRYVRIF
jgi:tetratricopeptide (TPR) repeat protein